MTDVFGFDEFDSGLDVVGGAVVDDFLHFLDRADQRTAEIDAVERSGQDVNLVRLFKVADADKAQGAFAFQGAQDAVHFELVGDGGEDEVEVAEVPGDGVGVEVEDDFARTEAFGVFDFFRRGGEDGHIRAHRGGELHGVVPDAAHADDADFAAFAHFPVDERRTGGNGGAHYRRGDGQRHGIGDADNEAVLDDDDVGITALGVAAGGRALPRSAGRRRRQRRRVFRNIARARPDTRGNGRRNQRNSRCRRDRPP